jgi:hypothetical protein
VDSCSLPSVRGCLGLGYAKSTRCLRNLFLIFYFTVPRLCFKYSSRSSCDSLISLRSFRSCSRGVGTAYTDCTCFCLKEDECSLPTSMVFSLSFCLRSEVYRRSLENLRLLVMRLMSCMMAFLSLRAGW